MKKNLKKLSILAISLLLAGCGGTDNGSSLAPASDGSNSVTESGGSSSTSNGGDHADTPTPVGPIAEKKVIPADGGNTGNLDAKGKFYTDYASLADEQQAAKECAIQIAAEGDVLLKNENNMLPFGDTTKHVTLFGMHSINLVTAGGGSGAGTTGNNGIAPTTLQQSMEDAGFQVNPVTLNLYGAYQAMGTVNNELPMSEYTPSVISSYYGYKDAAVITISRQGTENKDLATRDVADHANKDEHTLQLDDNEKALIKHVKENFGKVVVLINSSNIMQIPDLSAKKTDDNLGVDAILWIGGVGNNGVAAVGQILNGNVNPSGHTSDIWPADFTLDPTFSNFGWQVQNKDADGNLLDASYYDESGKRLNYSEVEYREGIYMGYKYYETYADDLGTEGDRWYKDNVLYPFGYGLSYTSFDWEWEGVPETQKITAANETVTVRVKVTNTGHVAGKDVVQVYYSAPYTKGGIEKASRNMVNFGKTDMLQPGESQILEIQFVAQDMASFDWDDKNGNDFVGYELEAGEYTITAQRNSHEVVLSSKRTVEQSMKIRKDYLTGNDINPIWSDESDDTFNSTNDTLLENLISREGGLAQPKAASKADRTLDDVTIQEYDAQDTYQHYQTKTTDPYYASAVPANWKQDDDADPSAHLNLSDMAGVDYQTQKLENGSPVVGTDEGSKKWDDFMNQLSWADMCNIVSGDKKSGPGIDAMDNIGKVVDNYKDGPVQIGGGTLFPSAPILAATFNVDLGEKMGRFVGNEGIFLGLSQWAGPGMNTHRSPFSGRNFEYYSQDGWHAARFAAAVIGGATSKGLITYVKHFFLNDQESYRADFGGVFTWATEQAIRETYLKPFEWAIKVGHSMGAMSSFNRIGKQVTATSYAVHQYLLRDEWGSKADVCTDAWAKDYVPVNKMAIAGSDQLLGSSKGYAKNSLDWGTWDAATNMVKVKADKDATENTVADPSLYFGIRTRAQRALFTRANSTTNRNGAVAGQSYSVTLEKGVANGVKITGEDVNFTIDPENESALPAGITLKNNKVLAGTPTAEGDYVVPVTIVKDGWITSSANLTIHVASALHYDGKPVDTGKAAAEYKAGDAVKAKIDIPALAYFNTMGSGWSMSLIVNNYIGTDGKWYSRDEDKTASDIICIPVDQAVTKNEYNYKVDGLPEGLKADVIMKSVVGKANKGSYDVPDYVEITGVAPAAGTYDFDVTLTYYTSPYFSGWIVGFFGGPTENTYTQKVTIVTK